MKRLVCIEWDATTETCTSSGWLDEPEPLFPQLTVAETYELATAILLLWGIAFVWRTLIRQANQS